MAGKKALGRGLRDLLPTKEIINKSAEDTTPQGKHKEVQALIDEYKAKGYVISKLSMALKEQPEAQEATIAKFKECVARLEEAQQIMHDTDVSGFEEQAANIEKKFKNPDLGQEVLDEVISLKNLIDEHRATAVVHEEKKMDAWMQDQKKVMIDLVGILKEHEKGVGTVLDEDYKKGPAPPTPSPTTTIVPSETIAEAAPPRDESHDNDPAYGLKVKLEEWKAKGYLVTRLEALIMDDVDKAKVEFENFERSIEKMNALRQKLDSLEIEGYEAKVRLIRTKLNYPNLASEVEKEIGKLERKIREDKGLPEPVEEPHGQPEPVSEPQPLQEPSPAPIVPVVQGSTEIPQEPTPEPPQEELFDPEAILTQIQPRPAGPPPEPVETPAPQPPPEPSSEPPTQEPTPVQGSPTPSDDSLFDPEKVLKEMMGGQSPPPEPPPQQNNIQTNAGAFNDQPGDIDNLLAQAQEAYRSHEFLKAVEFFDRVLKVDPTHSNAIFLRKRAASKLTE